MTDSDDLSLTAWRTRLSFGPLLSIFSPFLHLANYFELLLDVIPARHLLERNSRREHAFQHSGPERQKREAGPHAGDAANIRQKREPVDRRAKREDLVVLVLVSQPEANVLFVAPRRRRQTPVEPDLVTGGRTALLTS